MIHNVLDGNLVSFKVAIIVSNPVDSEASIASTVGSNNISIIRDGVRQRKKTINLSGRMTGTALQLNNKQIGVPNIETLARVDDKGYFATIFSRYIGAVYERELLTYEQERARGQSNARITTQLTEIESSISELGSFPCIVANFFSTGWNLNLNEYLGPKLPSTSLYTNKLSTYRDLAAQASIDSFPSFTPASVFDRAAALGLDFDESTTQTHAIPRLIPFDETKVDDDIVNIMLVQEAVSQDSATADAEVKRLVNDTEFESVYDSTAVNASLSDDLRLVSDPDFNTNVESYSLSESANGKVIVTDSNTSSSTTLSVAFEEIVQPGSQIRGVNYFKDLNLREWHSACALSAALHNHSRIPLTVAKVTGAQR